MRKSATGGAGFRTPSLKIQVQKILKPMEPDRHSVRLIHRRLHPPPGGWRIQPDEGKCEGSRQRGSRRSFTLSGGMVLGAGFGGVGPNTTSDTRTERMTRRFLCRKCCRSRLFG